MSVKMKLHFVIDKTKKAESSINLLLKKYKNYNPRNSDVIIVVGGDGFMLTAIHSPGAIEEFVELVVPELQRRGIFRTEYKGTTQREILNQND